MKYPIYGEYKDQVKAIASWCNNKETLERLLAAGHTDVHYQGNTSVLDIEDAVDMLYTQESWHDALPSADTTQAQARRIAQETCVSSHFTNKDTMLAALSIAMLAGAHPINEWCSKGLPDNYNRYSSYMPYQDSSYALRLTIDIGAFVGTGLTTDGAERTTSAVTMVITRTPCYVDGDKIPFSITTMFPDIKGETNVGTLAQTGRNFQQIIANEINNSDVAHRMYWICQDSQIPCFIVNTKIPTAIVPFIHNEGDKTYYCRFGYNDMSYNYGSLYIYNPDTRRYQNASQVGVPAEIIAKIRHEEDRLLGHLLNRARDKNTDAITTESSFFRKGEECLLFEDGAQIDTEELEYPS